MASSKQFGTVPANAEQQPEPFEVKFPEKKLEDLKTLLRLSPVAKDTYENHQDDRRFGVTREWMLDAKKYWEEKFDWRKHEAHINGFPNFIAKIKDDDGKEFDMHFAALFSEKKDAIPVAFLHGWPGSFLEFLPIMDILRKKYSPKDLPYHIIAPSLPGYTLSSPPPLDKDWDINDTARILHKLFLSLGFGETGYIVQGGDVGSMAGRVIAATYPECKGMHLNFMFMSKPDDVSDNTITEQEKHGFKKIEYFRTLGNAYGRMHGTRPATIGHVLASSPIALLAWIGEKFLQWTDEDLPLDTVLADITLYWLCESFPTCIYTYRGQDLTHGTKGYFHGQKHLYVDKPTGYSYFPEEIWPMPKSWAETTCNLVSFSAHETGGHFAALEKPEELWADVEEYLQKAWKK